ncbi:MAG: flagellar biosynthetic protein FliO [Pseudomonadota bacterium]
MKKTSAVLVRAGAFLLAGAPSRAFPAEAQAPGANAPDLLVASLNMIGGAALVIGLLLLIAYLLKKYGPSRLLSFSDRDVIKIIAAKPLGPKKFITLVQIGDDILTLGVTEASITRLDKTGAAEFQQAQALKPPDERRVKSFAQRLKAFNREADPAPEEV